MSDDKRWDYNRPRPDNPWDAENDDLPWNTRVAMMQAQMEHQQAAAPRRETPAPQPEAVNKPLSDVAMALLLGFLAGTIAVGLATLAFIFL